VKTGKLLKFPGRTADVHAYVYRDGALYRASIYVLAAGARPGATPAREITGRTAASVEADVRAWVERNYPRRP
jgi:hypothetical protein